MYVESKRFTFSSPPKGHDIVSLIKDNDLRGWRMDIEQKMHRINPNNLGMFRASPYVWEVTFERDVEA